MKKRKFKALSDNEINTLKNALQGSDEANLIKELDEELANREYERDRLKDWLTPRKENI